MLFRLVNEQQSNNCFVNVVVQNIWHLTGLQNVLKELILEYPRLKQQDGIVYFLSKLLKEIKESREGSIHSVSTLKEAILTEMFGKGCFDWNEQADASEAFLLVLKKTHDYFGGQESNCSCKIHSACQLTLRKKILCRWPNCQGVRNEELDSDVFQQLCYVRPWLEFVQDQDRYIQEKYQSRGRASHMYRRDPLGEIKLARGQFFQVFKMISKDLSQVKCPKECG